MAIDFTLTQAQRRLQRIAREFSLDVLAPLVRAADETQDTQKAFSLVKGAYLEAYKLGFATGFLPKKYGGGGVSNMDLQVIAEEITAVDPGFATILLVNGLALMPLVWFGSEAQKRKWLTLATSDPRGEYVAGWTVSEAAGSPGGTANFDHPDPVPCGITLVAVHDRANGEYVLNGSKRWPCNSAGWDLKGADVNNCIVRTAPQEGGSTGLSCILVPRGAKGIKYGQPLSKIGHRICQNNVIEFKDCRVSEENVFAVGYGDLAINKAFTWSAPVAAIASVGVARSAYEFALNWAKTNTAGGSTPIIEHQAVGYALAEVAMKIEACRTFAWKAAHYHDLYDANGHAIGPMAKIFCGETLFGAVYQAMKVVGVNALDKELPLERYLREATVFPLYDAGNMGMQMRKLWGIMKDPNFDPRAITNCAPTPFNKTWPPKGSSKACQNKSSSKASSPSKAPPKGSSSKASRSAKQA